MRIGMLAIADPVRDVPPPRSRTNVDQVGDENCG